MRELISDYYIFEASCNTEETGPEYPQVQEMGPGYDYKATNSVYAISKAVNSFPEYEPNLNYFLVHSKAKLTDILSAAPIHGGFLISSRFKCLFEKFNLVSHKYYPATVQYKKQIYSYYWMHIISNLTNFVDYQNSSFFIYYNYSHNLGHIDVSSKEDLLAKEKKLKQDNPGKWVAIWAEKIKLTTEFDKSLSLFKIGTFDSNYYVNEQLKGAIIAEKITGCSFKASNITF